MKTKMTVAMNVEIQVEIEATTVAEAEQLVGDGLALGSKGLVAGNGQIAGVSFYVGKQPIQLGVVKAIH